MHVFLFFRTLQQVFIFAFYLLQCLKPKEIHFLFKFGCVCKYHLSGLSTLNAMVSRSLSALKSSSFVCLCTCVHVCVRVHVRVCVCGCSYELMEEGKYSDRISRGYLIKF